MRKEDIQKFIKTCRQIMDRTLDVTKMEDDELKAAIEKIVTTNLEGIQLPNKERKEIVNELYSSVRGLGILDGIMDDDSITEVMINGQDNIFIERNGVVEKLDKKFESERRLIDIIQRIVGQVGREVNMAKPIQDARLEDGSRVNVVLPPISLSGPILTIRKFSKKPMTIEQLIKYGSITPEIAHKLELLVKAKYNIFICGGTGSGKTTFLNALSNYIPKGERIITIEDSAELQIVNVENIVSLETRAKNTAGEGEITIKDLIKASLRMRPERIIVGEVRGGEALDMLQAMNTGHDGSLSTGHANSSKDMLSRLETMVLQGSANIPLMAIRQQISSAIDIIVHLSRLRDHSRKVMEISEVLGLKDGEIQLNTLYRFEEDEHSTLKKVSGSLNRTENALQNDSKLLLSGIHENI